VFFVRNRTPAAAPRYRPQVARYFSRPLFYVGTALIYLLLAVPMGRLADRVGRGRVFLGGQLFLMALASAILPEDLRTSGIALLTTGIAIAQLVASIAFGAMWGWIGPQQAALYFTIGLLVTTAVSTALLAANREITA
jgi:MFS family permease